MFRGREITRNTQIGGGLVQVLPRLTSIRFSICNSAHFLLVISDKIKQRQELNKCASSSFRRQVKSSKAILGAASVSKYDVISRNLNMKTIIDTPGSVCLGYSAG